MATGHGFHCLFQIGIHIRVVQNRLGVHADVVVDDELQAGQTHALVGQLAEVKSQLRVTHIHHDLDVNLGHHAALHFRDLRLQQAVIDKTGIALCATHGNQHAVLELFGGMSTTDHRRDTQFAGNDGGVAGAPAPVGDDGRSTLHHRFPVGVGHVGDQNVTGLHLVHVGNVVHDAHRAGTNLLSDGPAVDQNGALALELVAVLHLVGRLALHRLGSRLQDVEQAVRAVLAPLDVHGAAVMLFNHQGIACQLLHISISQ